MLSSSPLHPPPPCVFFPMKMVEDELGQSNMPECPSPFYSNDIPCYQEPEIILIVKKEIPYHKEEGLEFAGHRVWTWKPKRGRDKHGC